MTVTMKNQFKQIIQIPESHKSIVRERIIKSNKNPERLLDWDSVKEKFEF
jgi:hypothetical protein